MFAFNQKRPKKAKHLVPYIPVINGNSIQSSKTHTFLFGRMSNKRMIVQEYGNKFGSLSVD